jgi:hypothetical protein
MEFRNVYMDKQEHMKTEIHKMGGEICALTLRLEELLQELMSPLYMCS